MCLCYFLILIKILCFIVSIMDIIFFYYRKYFNAILFIFFYIYSRIYSCSCIYNTGIVLSFSLCLFNGESYLFWHSNIIFYNIRHSYLFFMLIFEYYFLFVIFRFTILCDFTLMQNGVTIEIFYVRLFKHD